MLLTILIIYTVFILYGWISLVIETHSNIKSDKPVRVIHNTFQATFNVICLICWFIVLICYL